MIEYRASELGGCYKALIAKRMGFVPADPPARTQVLFDEGNLHERAVLDTIASAYDMQAEVRLQVTPSIEVVGHIDAMDAMSRRVIEVKSMGEKPWIDFKMNGWAAGGLIPKYQWQISVYMLATGCECVVYAKNRNSGAIDERIVPYPFYDLAAIRTRVLSVEAKARVGDLPTECNPSQYPCPFYYLHDEDPVQQLGTVEIGAFDAAAESYMDAKDAETRAKKVMADSRELLEKMVSGTKIESTRFSATPYTQTRKSLSRQSLEDFCEDNPGVTIEQFEEEKTVDGLRIGRTR